MDKETELRVLRRARELIRSPGAWCRGTSARDADGYPVSSTSNRAVVFCGAGAVWRAAYELGVSHVDSIPLATGQVWDGNPLPDINDNDGHAAVLGHFDRRISELELEVVCTPSSTS